MENGLAYDFVIGNGNGMGDGEIAVGRRWTQQLDGGHLASEAQNKIAIGICLVGNFDDHPPTRREMEGLRALVQALMVRCELTPRAVKTHQQINIAPTRCPGAKFPTQSFLDSLQSPGGNPLCGEGRMDQGGRIFFSCGQNMQGIAEDRHLPYGRGASSPCGGPQGVQGIH